MNDFCDESDCDILKDKIITTAIKHVVFDGWSEVTISKVCNELSLSRAMFGYLFPRGGVDLALAFHKSGDIEFKKTFINSNCASETLRLTERIESAIYNRLEIGFEKPEVLRRSLALFSNPLYIFDSARSIWSTADLIWNSVGDESDDLNWYSKRAILSSVYSASLLYGLDDESSHRGDTREFIQRSLKSVMAIQSIKNTVNAVPFLTKFVNNFEKSSYSRSSFKKQFPGYKFND